MGLGRRKCQTHGLGPFSPPGKLGWDSVGKANTFPGKSIFWPCPLSPGSGCCFGGLSAPGKQGSPKPAQAGASRWPGILGAFRHIPSRIPQTKGQFQENTDRKPDSWLRPAERSQGQTRWSRAGGDGGVSCKQVSSILPALLHTIPLSREDISWIRGPMGSGSKLKMFQKRK